MASDVRQLRGALTRWGVSVHDQALDTMPDNMRGYAPIRDGKLRASIQRDRRLPSIAGERIRGRIIAPVVQAKTTDQGSPAHVIRPRRAGGLLVFYWPKLGRTVGFRYVNHPGNAPKPWWDRALRATWGPALRFAAIRTPLR